MVYNLDWLFLYGLRDNLHARMGQVLAQVRWILPGNAGARFDCENEF